MSKSLDPEQARYFVGPDLRPNCLQSLSADDTNCERRENTTFRRLFLASMYLFFINPYPANIFCLDNVFCLKGLDEHNF